MKKIIECVPNFSEGRNKDIIKQITDAIESVHGVKLLHVDMGAATNRTVVTFAGGEEEVVEAAFRAVKKASELIDMRLHKGEHPRQGATDVCPFIPISNATMEDCIRCAHKLGKRVGEELGIPVYLYEEAATAPHRKNLASIRAGEYEGFPQKIKLPEWQPDYGPAVFNEKSGNLITGARKILIAYNVNLNTTSVRRANSVAFDVREQGRKVKNEKGEEVHQPGWCKAVKAIGWYIEEYGIAQVSMNLTDLEQTPLHIAFDACVKSAYERGLRVTGSELVGLVPLKSLLDAGKYFLEKQRRSAGVSESELIRIAIKSLGLDELAPFKPEERIIEYVLRNKDQKKLAALPLSSFADEVSSESPAPGGGSVAAYVGALGASLGAMVANLSANKKGWDERWQYFSNWAIKGQWLKDQLWNCVDEDTEAFNEVMKAFSLPQKNEEEKTQRAKAIEQATRKAALTPLRVMELAVQSYELIKEMAEKGNPNSISDAGVGAACIHAAVTGAYLNVKINLPGMEDENFKKDVLQKADKLFEQSSVQLKLVLDLVNRAMSL
ncbi:MAG: glutamate formimidoyltransferase [Chitinophagales bacterium]|nr:glutamate formimidoyltransferase [Chitinophagales bacterium]